MSGDHAMPSHVRGVGVLTCRGEPCVRPELCIRPGTPGDHKDRPYCRMNGDSLRTNNDSSRQNRRSIRLQGYNYSQAGAYFMTICTQNRECLFGDIVDGKMRLNDAGEMIRIVWDALSVRFTNAELDEFVVMPNHIHGIVVLTRRGEPCVRPGTTDGQTTDDHTTGDHKDRPYGTLPDTIGRILQAFKSITTHEYTNGVKQNGWSAFPGKLWQRNFWEHIVRDEPELIRIRAYIHNNPAQWESDNLNVRANAPNCAPNTIRERSPEYATEAWMV